MKLQIILGILILLSILSSACQPVQTIPTSATVEVSPQSTAYIETKPAAESKCVGATDSAANTHFSFDEIVSCLNTPEKMTVFLQNNMVWDPEWDIKNFNHNAYLPASEVYANGVDDCDGMAEFIACVLSQNGYEAYNVAISIKGLWGFNAGGYVGKDGLKYAFSSNAQPDGPFLTWEELAQSYIDLGLAKPDGVIWLFSPCIGNRAEEKAVLNLSHTVVR